MSQGRRKHSPAFKAKVAPGGAEGPGDGGPAGRPVRSPSRADSSLEEGPCGGSLRCLRQRQGAEVQERQVQERLRPDRPPVPGDRPVEGGAGFLGGEVRSMSPATAAADGGPGTSVPFPGAPVRAAGGEPFQHLLPAPGCLGRGPVPDGRDRPAVPGDALLWVQADEGLAGSAGEAGEPEAGAAADARHGVAGHLPAAWHQPKGAGAPGLSLPAAERENHPAQPSMGRGHHLPAHGPGVPLPGGGDGLAQPVRAGLAAVQYPRSGSGAGSGGWLLRRGAGGSPGSGTARGVQHRPRKPVHQPGSSPRSSRSTG